jgi:hypothetical protein
LKSTTKTLGAVKKTENLVPQENVQILDTHTYIHTCIHFVGENDIKNSAHVAHQTWYLEGSMYKSQSSGSQFSISNCYHNPLLSSIAFSASQFFHCLLQSRACPATPEKKPKKIQQRNISSTDSTAFVQMNPSGICMRNPQRMTIPMIVQQTSIYKCLAFQVIGIKSAKIKCFSRFSILPEFDQNLRKIATFLYMVQVCKTKI